MLSVFVAAELGCERCEAALAFLQPRTPEDGSFANLQAASTARARPEGCGGRSATHPGLAADALCPPSRNGPASNRTLL